MSSFWPTWSPRELDRFVNFVTTEWIQARCSRWTHNTRRPPTRLRPAVLPVSEGCFTEPYRACLNP
jgi:hypothetical protein